MQEKDRKIIVELIGSIECPKNFKCVEQGLEVLCKAQNIGLNDYLVCIEENPTQCHFSIPFGEGFLCECPLRKYISEKLKK